MGESPVRRFLREGRWLAPSLFMRAAKLEEQMAEMKAGGCAIVRRPEPAIAFDGRRIAGMFTSEKPFVELVEKGNQQVT